MKIIIAGGSGFIGKKLTEYLIERGHEVVVLTRGEGRASKNITYVQWLTSGATPEKELGRVDVFINLAGVSINQGRWKVKHQRKIYTSRMEATGELLRIMQALPNKPKTFINASAIGIFPTSLEATYTEDSMERADDFLGKTVSDWERKAETAENFGVRTVFMRFGVVLGATDGALPLMVLPYKLFVGGTVGSGMQWVSWVHIYDVIRAIDFAIENETIRGPVHVTAPTPIRMKEFGKTIGKVLKRPHWLPTPAILLKVVFGKKSQLVVEGQRVLPIVLQKHGFQFKYPKLETALTDLLRRE